MIESQSDDSEGWLSTHAKDGANHSSSSSSSASSSTPSSSSSSNSSSSAASSTNDLAHATAKLTLSSESSIGDIDDIDDDVVAPSQNNKQANTAPPTTQRLPSHEEDIPDMEAFDEDDNVVRPRVEEETKDNALPYLKAEEPEDNIVRTYVQHCPFTLEKYSISCTHLQNFPCSFPSLTSSVNTSCADFLFS